jgi:hypothetical protein
MMTPYVCERARNIRWRVIMYNKPGRAREGGERVNMKRLDHQQLLYVKECIDFVCRALGDGGGL